MKTNAVAVRKSAENLPSHRFADHSLSDRLDLSALAEAASDLMHVLFPRLFGNHHKIERAKETLRSTFQTPSAGRTTEAELRNPWLNQTLGVVKFRDR